MQGVAEEDAAIGVWQPVNVAAMPTAEKTASNERGFVFTFTWKAKFIWNGGYLSTAGLSHAT